MASRLREKFHKDIAPALQKELELKNPMAVPRLLRSLLLLLRRFLLSFFLFCHVFSTSSHGFGVATGS